jgi:hypothetical protein
MYKVIKCHNGVKEHLNVRKEKQEKNGGNMSASAI